MADGDKITIDQINFGSDIPEWATEATQQKILNHLKGEKKTDDEDLKQQKTQTKTLKTVAEQFKELNKNSSENSKKLVATLNKKGGDYTKDLVKKNIQTPFKSVNAQLGKFAGRLGFVGAGLGAFATAVGFVVGRLKQFSDSYRQVFAMGFRFEQGSMGLAKAAVAAEMGINEYTEILGKYSTSVGILGTQAFSELNVALRDNLQNQGLLGMGLAELTEYTADYVDQLRTTGILSEQNVENLEVMAENYLKNITAFTQLANVSRDQINAVVKSATSIDAFTNKLNTLPATLQRNVLAAAQTVAGMFAGIGSEFGDQLATTFTQAYGRGGLFFTEAGRELLAVNKRLYNSLDGIINNMESLDDGSAANATADLIEEIANTSDAERERLGIIERSNTEYAGAARQQIALINKIQQLEEEGKIEIYKDLQKLREESKIDRLSVAFINFERVIQKFRMVFNTFFTRLFGNDRLLNAIESAMETLSNKANDLADWVLSFAERVGTWLGNWMGELTQATSLGDFIAKAFGPIFSALGKAITDAIVAGWNKISMDIPFLGKSRSERFDEFYDPYRQLERSGANNQSQLNQQMQDAQVTRDYLQRQLDAENAKGARPDDQSMLGKLFKGDAFYYDEDKAKKLDDRIKDLDTTIKQLSKDIELSAEKNKEAMALLKAENRAEFEKIFDEYNYEASMDAGKLVRKTETAAGAQQDKANAVSDMDPQSVQAARMRIMKQYLPMTGSSDPSQTAEGEYYASSLAIMQRIEENTSKAAKATQSTATAVES